MSGFKHIFRCFLCLLCIYFVGCGSNTNLKNTKLDSKLPEYLYGQGSGITFENAKAEAIKDLSTNLQVSVKYNAQDNTTQNGNKLTSRGYTNIALESQIKDLPSIEVVKNTKQNNTYYVQVRVDKNVLQDSIFTRLSSSENILNSILQECGTTSFSTHEKFKKILKEYKRDVSLYQILTKDASFSSTELNKYEKIASLKPGYNVVTNAESVFINSRISSIVLNEIDKFITIDDNAKSVLFVEFDNPVSSDSFRIDFRFFSCKGESKLDSAINVNTHINGKSLMQEKNLRRVGPIIYKTFNEYIESKR